MTTVVDKFWSDDLYVLARPDRLLEFFISEDMSVDEKLNSIVRFGVYASVLLALYHKKYKYLTIVLPILLLTLVIHSNYSETEIENFDSKGKPIKKKFTLPTLNNPFGNNSIMDILDNPKRPPMIDYSSYSEEALKVKKEIDEKFNYNLYKDLGDVYGKENSQRQFYTAPNRGNIPNDPDGEFKQWLYGSSKSCKEGSCAPYEDLRNRSRIEKEKTKN